MENVSKTAQEMIEKKRMESGQPNQFNNRQPNQFNNRQPNQLQPNPANNQYQGQPVNYQPNPYPPQGGQFPQKRTPNLEPVKYMVGENQITLDVETIKRQLVSGSPELITEQELAYFMALCKSQGLNPFVKDAYLLKTGTMPATIITSVQALEKRAETFPEYDGMRSGIIVLDRNGNLNNREGALFLPRMETLVGGWAEVYRKDRKIPTHIEVSFDEFAQRKKDGDLNKFWKEKPAVMIRKVAKSTALREAFPTHNSGLYSPEEVSKSTPEALEADSKREQAETVRFDDK